MTDQDAVGNPFEAPRSPDEPLLVYREIFGHYQLVGRLTSKSNWSDTQFTYDRVYLDSARFDDFANPTPFAISNALPLQREPFNHVVTSSFFLNLLPEGDVREILDARTRTSPSAYQKLLEHLDHESAGALVFGREGEDLEMAQGYDPIPDALFQRFASRSALVAADLDLERHISMAGSQHKIGLYRDPMAPNDPTEGWYLPRGTAPTTHLVKATSNFPNMTINEAICLEAARLCEFDVPDSFLIPIEGEEPLLAVERFDRLMPVVRGQLVGGERLSDIMDFTGEELAEFTLGEVAQKPTMLDGLPRPYRRHQEDLLQSLGLQNSQMYEPTDGHYASIAAGTIDRCAERPLDDRIYFFNQLLYDLLIGNCDNHLKNYAFIWDGGWRGCRLSPMYDLICTTYYENTYREMGVSFCRSRKIDDVTWNDVLATGRAVGVPMKMVPALFDELGGQIVEALRKAAASIATRGFPIAHEIASFIEADATRRISMIMATR